MTTVHENSWDAGGALKRLRLECSINESDRLVKESPDVLVITHEHPCELIVPHTNAAKSRTHSILLKAGSLRSKAHGSIDIID